MYPDITEPGWYHAALYIRLSREDENEGPSESVTNQKAMLCEFTKIRGIDVFDTYIDDGWSGTNFERPGFMRMVRDIDSGHVNMVITKDLSRLGRDYIMTGYYMERYFPEKRVRYISLLDGIDTGIDSGANDITPFRAIMNDMYAKDISKKIRSVKHAKQRCGQFIGGKPVYGYMMHPEEKNRIVIDQGAAPTVRRIFNMAADGLSCRKIADTLNGERILSPAVYCGRSSGRNGPYSGLWSGERISEMLKNETYIGSMVQGRSVKVSYKSKKSCKLPPEKWIVVQNTHEPIIDEATFQRVQMLIKSRTGTRTRTYDHLLKGLIYCHECGHPLGVINRKNAVGEDVLYFVCRTYQRFTKSGVCSSHYIKVSTVTNAVLLNVRHLSLPFMDASSLLNMALSAVEAAKRHDKSAQEREDICNKMADYTAKIDTMYMDRLTGLITEADFDRLYRIMKSEYTAFEDRLHALENRDDCSDAEFADKLVDRFINGAYNDRAFLCCLIDRVELTSDKRVIVKFRFRKPEAVFAV